MFLPPSCGRSHGQTCRTLRSTLRERPAMKIEMTVFVLNLRCVLKVITLVTTNQHNSFENTIPCKGLVIWAFSGLLLGEKWPDNETL